MAVVAVSHERAELGEGPRLDQRTDQVLWVDILAGRLYRCRLTGGRLQTEAVINLGRHLGAVAPLEKPGAGWVVAAGQGFAQVAEDGTVTTLAEPEAGPGPRTRMNDGACDPAGRFWAGSTAYDETPGAGTLYRLDRDLVVTPVVGGLTISNGIGWSPDATTLYLADSGAGTLDAFDFDLERGEVDRRRELVRFTANAVADGLCVDDEGCLWVAVWGGGEIRRYTPNGDLMSTVRMPVSQPTACCFAGPHRTTLLVTSARAGLSEAALKLEPDAGRMFALDPGVSGPCAFPYRPLMAAQAY
jgi:sugar lactone lactonase YvrE